MEEKLYTRVSEEFDPENPAGVLVCASSFEDTYGFSEKGYDAVDYDSPPVVFEVIPQVEGFASAEEAIAADRAAGIAIFDTHDQIDEARRQGTFAGKWEDGDCYCLEEDPINRIVVESPEFRASLEKAGIVAIRDYVVVSNYEPLFTILWKPDTYSLRGPLELEAAPDADGPYHVVLADVRNAGTPRP